MDVWAQAEVTKDASTVQFNWRRLIRVHHKTLKLKQQYYLIHKSSMQFSLQHFCKIANFSDHLIIHTNKL